MSAASRVAKLLGQVDRIDGRSPRLRDMPALARSLTDSEEDFFLRAHARGDVDIMRHGWPDFLLVDRAGGPAYCVEVKHDLTDFLRPNQVAMAEVLEQAGIPVYVWTPVERDKLIPWRAFATRAVCKRREAQREPEAGRAR